MNFLSIQWVNISVDKSRKSRMRRDFYKSRKTRETFPESLVKYYSI